MYDLLKFTIVIHFLKREDILLPETFVDLESINGKKESNLFLFCFSLDWNRKKKQEGVVVLFSNVITYPSMTFRGREPDILSYVFELEDNFFYIRPFFSTLRQLFSKWIMIVVWSKLSPPILYSFWYTMIITIALNTSWWSKNLNNYMYE